MHLRDQMLDTLQTRILSVDGIIGDRLRIDPAMPAQQEDLPGVTLMSGPESPAAQVGEQDCLDRDCTWQVDCEIRCEVNTPQFDSPANPTGNDILEELLPAIFVDTDLNGLATLIRLGPVVQTISDEGDIPMTLLVASIWIDYHYHLSDPSVAN